jgi:hypothetical protein
MEVNYWGRIAIPYPESAQLYSELATTPDSAPYDERPFRWRCRRNQSSVTCWAMNWGGKRTTGSPVTKDSRRNDESDPAFLYHPRPQAGSGKREQEQHPNLKKIYLRDLELRRSDTRAITGDLRPYYVVSGRIQNYTGETLGGVAIRILVESRGSLDSTSRDYNEHWLLFDQADISIKGPIPDLSTKGFSQQVQLLPPTGEPWTWEADVIEAENGKLRTLTPFSTR